TDKLWRFMVASYNVLNKTHPELTDHCWLCYNTRPHFYEAVGTIKKARRINGSNPAQCLWKRTRPGNTLAQISGEGRCVG
ncbi:ENV2 protein, partial [Grantiella picta]|nr:ENV2 protein [Grantiella picta]